MFAMVSDDRRLRAFLAALRKIREHVEDRPEDDWKPTLYNGWIDKLQSDTSEDFSKLRLPDKEIWGLDFLVALDSCIAFIETLEPEQ
jgi:hypothetical protein